MAGVLLGQSQPEPEEPEVEIPESEFPDQLDPSLRKQWNALQNVRVKNAKLNQRLATQGVGLDPMSILHTRLSALIDTVFDGTTRDGQQKMLELEAKFEDSMGAVLQDATANVVKARLSQGGQLSPDMIQAMAEQAGIVEGSRSKHG